MPTEKLSIDISSEMARVIRHAVDDGAYGSGSDVVADALNLWQQRQARVRAIRQDLDSAASDPTRYGDDEMTAYLDGLFAEATPSR